MTPDKVKAIQEIINKYMKVLKHVVTGDSKITPELLKKYNIPKEFLPLLDYSYRYGVLNERNTGKALDAMRPSELSKLLGNVQLSSTHSTIVEYARLNAGASMDTLTNTIINRVTTLCVLQGVTEKEAVGEIVTAGLEQYATRGVVKQALQDATQDWKRDWDRVAHTEMWNAKCMGEAQAILDNTTILSTEGEDTIVFKRPCKDEGVCMHCKRLYLEEDGVTPRLFRLSELMANGNNYYKKTADWKAVLGTMHPNCRCVLGVMPPNMCFDKDGNMVAKRAETAEPSAPDAELSKAITNRAGLTAKKVQMVRDGKAFMQTVWVKTDEPVSPPTPQQKSNEGMQLAPENREEWPDYIPKHRIPPAWTDVRFSNSPDADLLAVGLDSKGRRQYIYSEDAIHRGQEEKFTRIDKLNEVYDSVDKQIVFDTETPPPEQQEVAECMLLVSRMGLRPGSEIDTKAEKEARGATTLRGEDVKIDSNGKVSLEFVGKKGVSISLAVDDPEIAEMLTRRKKQAGDSGQLFNTSERNMRAYADSLGGFKTKDFRTRLGTSTAQSMVEAMPVPSNVKELKKAIQQVAKEVSTKLGNTPSVALKAYINPSVFKAWEGVVQHA